MATITALGRAHACTFPGEASIVTTKSVMVVFGTAFPGHKEEDFCGRVVMWSELQTENNQGKLADIFRDTAVYLVGDMSTVSKDTLEATFRSASRILIVADMVESADSFKMDRATRVTRGAVPVMVHGVGVMYRNLFGGTEAAEGGENNEDIFTKLTTDHSLQALTESNKPGAAYRTGIYLTEVEREADESRFRLLRCSSNLAGPTASFRATDRQIVSRLNTESRAIFDGASAMNHVLAQAYWNNYVVKEGTAPRTPEPDSHSSASDEGEVAAAETVPVTTVTKQAKAKIKAHADKTKDMPREGVMAFCTFYNEQELRARLQKFEQDDDATGLLGSFDCPSYDWGHWSGKNGKKKVFSSGMTKLRFELKQPLAQRQEAADFDEARKLPKRFDVVLFPNSVFMMPLSTNRLYTHQTVPGGLDVCMLPTRLGYVVRCSKTEAVRRDGCTYVKNAASGRFDAKLVEPTQAGIADLKKLYGKENDCDELMDYGVERGEFLFSLNKGDYMCPIVYEEENVIATPTGGSAAAPDSCFRSFSIDDEALTFDSLSKGIANWEVTGKGREGAILVRQCEQGVPIVRTTTKYEKPAHTFGKLHEQLADKILERAAAEADVVPAKQLNNCMIERYSHLYKTMGFHSDQAQDLEDGTFVFVFSCYKHADKVQNPRKLVVQKKRPEEQGDKPATPEKASEKGSKDNNKAANDDSSDTFEIPMPNNSVVFFSLETNKHWKHKIVIDDPQKPDDGNEWLGLTCRTSKFFAADANKLSLATPEQAREIYRLQKCATTDANFVWPQLDFTLSPSDLLQPDPIQDAN
eukprot:TRINITY_DN90195_c0_g1_i1.p1 TRINITY_DN90195_c0_g1~~TRINITY_DN90195_c0_g1_i1.p1  ORF type:complete len:809 (+),score=157.25 TRINITY_DN90195_c0_g1_i1:127-2553(+)